jgi:excisionase family DNA binding protein
MPAGALLWCRGRADQYSEMARWWTSLSTVATKLLTLAQASKQLGVGASALRMAIHRGALRATLYGKVWLVEQKALDQYAARPSRQTRDPRKRRGVEEHP